MESKNVTKNEMKEEEDERMREIEWVPITGALSRHLFLPFDDRGPSSLPFSSVVMIALLWP